MVKASRMDLGVSQKSLPRHWVYMAAMSACSRALDSTDGFYIRLSKLLEISVAAAEQMGYSVEQNPVADVLFQRSDATYFDDIKRSLQRIQPSTDSEPEVYWNLEVRIYKTLLGDS